MHRQYTVHNMHVTEHLLSVPLDWAAPAHSDDIKLFAREVVLAENENKDLPLLLFLQGGPGGKSPRPMPNGLPWLNEALKTYRVILLDQRGTGQSSRVDSALMSQLSTEEGRDYLLKFRADSIVADCEHLRKTVYGGRRFHTLGQSYGGFITLTYLSRAPEGLAACYITGGLAGLDVNAEEVYQLTYQRVMEKNLAYYSRYPDDKAIVDKIAQLLTTSTVRLPDGDQLTLERFQSIGLRLGMGPGIDQTHWLMEEAFAGSDSNQLSDVFLEQVMQLTCFHDNPLFAAVHESIYGQPTQNTGWAAQKIRSHYPDFSADNDPIMFTGEMIYPRMFEQTTSLKAFKNAANKLAEYEDYEPLYDREKLAINKVPVVAAVYYHDMYVPRELSLKTAEQVANTHVWVTKKYEHDGLRQSSEVFKTLHKMLLECGGPISEK